MGDPLNVPPGVAFDVRTHNGKLIAWYPGMPPLPPLDPIFIEVINLDDQPDVPILRSVSKDDHNGQSV